MWKHKTKWLVRGGRKVRCYLCGKKILAEGDLYLFHGDTGYYSHQSCQAESTTISGNERRRAVKKIAVGAAVVGAIAAGAGKFLDVSSQSKNSPAAQTILTSQGLIPPALTSDPANPVPGQMWYRSDAGVEAHFDGVQNRVVYSSEINDGNVHVTSKGIVNGLSVLPNDGTGWFGPDTTEGATAPGQYGGTYTETLGLQEGLTYIEDKGGELQISSGVFQIKSNLTYSSNYSLKIRGLRARQSESNPLSYATGTVIDVSQISGFAFTFNSSTANNNNGFLDMAGLLIRGQPISYTGSTSGSLNGGSGILIGNSTSAPAQVMINDMHFQFLDQDFVATMNGGPLMMDEIVSTYCGNSTSTKPIRQFNAIMVYIGRWADFEEGTSGGSTPAIWEIGGLSTVSSYFAIDSYICYNTNINPFQLDNYLEVIQISNLQLNNQNFPLFMLNNTSTTLTIQVGEVKWNMGVAGRGSVLQPLADIGQVLCTINAIRASSLASVTNNPDNYTAGSGSYLIMNNVDFPTVPPALASGDVFVQFIMKFIDRDQFIPPAPTISSTVQQNTSGIDYDLVIPVYASTSGTPGTVQVVVGPNSDGYTDAFINQYVYVSGSTTSSAVQLITIRIPAWFYFYFTLSKVTNGTPTVIPA